MRPLSFSPAAERNQAPILEALRRVLPLACRVLEIASGTGQHAAHFGGAQPRWEWQPSDRPGSDFGSIDARCADLLAVRPAVALDVLQEPWPVTGSFDAVYCANLLHISPWETCSALMRGAAACLAPGGVLLVYGPFLIDGVPVAPGNQAFDADLRARDPAWGLRRLAAVQAQAQAAGLTPREVLGLPANNCLLVFTASIPSRCTV